MKFLVALVVIFIVTSEFTVAQRKDAYSYQGAEVRVWQDFKPTFNFKSRPIQPITYQPFPYEPLIPKTPVIYSYPAHDNEDFDYDYRNFQHLPPINKKPMGVVNVTAERMGGFGGTGDTRGYGAYDYKKTEDVLYDQQKLDNKPYKTKAKKGKKKKEAYTYMGTDGDYYGDNSDGRSNGFNFDKDSSFNYGNVEDVADEFMFNGDKQRPVNDHDEYAVEEPYKNQNNKPYKYKKVRPYQYKSNKKHEYQKIEPLQYKTNKEQDYPKNKPYNYKTNEQYKYEDQEAVDPFRYMDDMFVGMNFDDFFRLPKDRKDN